MATDALAAVASLIVMNPTATLKLLPVETRCAGKSCAAGQD
jgi:hypothetical protein